MTKPFRNLLIVIGVIILIGFVVVKVIKVPEIILKKIYPKDYSNYVYKYSEENGIDPLLTFSIIKAESNFNPNVTSKSNAIGLMQLMESTAKEMAEILEEDLDAKEALYNPEMSIKIGTKYFSTLMKKYNQNYVLSLTAYNAGIGNVDKWIEEGTIRMDGSDIENIPYQETNRYVRKIIRDYKIYQDLYNN